MENRKVMTDGVVIMKKKSPGMTLIEAIISLAILTIAFSAIYLFFSSSNRTLVETEMKSELQQDVQVIQEQFSRIGKESIGIEELTLKTGMSEITEITFRYPSQVVGSEIKYELFEFSIVRSELKLKKYNVTSKSDGDIPIIEYEKSLSKNIDHIIVTDINGAGISEGNINNIKSVKIEVGLVKEKGLSTKSLDVSTVLYFRNK